MPTQKPNRSTWDSYLGELQAKMALAILKVEEYLTQNPTVDPRIQAQRAVTLVIYELFNNRD